MAAQGIINYNPATQPDPNVPSVTTATSDLTAPAAPAPSTVIPASTAGIMNTPANAAAPTATTPPAQTDYTSQIQGAYQKYLGRAGDQGGLDFYNHWLNNGKTMDDVNGYFTNSDEYKAMHPAAPPVTPTSPGNAAPAQLGTPTQWNITPDQTVQGQMRSLIDPNNPYYQHWATAGAQDAAARGFTGNSTIRDTGIMNSVMAGATPIATSDAATYAKAAGYNADMPNQFAMKNQDAMNQNILAHLSSETQKFVSNLSADTQKTVQQMSQDSQAAISKAHDANAVLLGSNDAAKNAYTNYVAAVAQIDQNDKMDAAAKQAAIVTQTQLFNSTIAGLKASSPGTPNITSPLDINAAAQQVGGVDVSAILKDLG